MALVRATVRVDKLIQDAETIVYGLEGRPTIEAESIVILAYLRMCAAVKRYPQATKFERIGLALERMSASLAQIAEEVGAAPDPEIRSGAQRPKGD